jgi:hypothetical protein
VEYMCVCVYVAVVCGGIFIVAMNCSSLVRYDDVTPLIMMSEIMSSLILLL